MKTVYFLEVLANINNCVFLLVLVKMDSLYENGVVLASMCKCFQTCRKQSVSASFGNCGTI